MNRLIILIILSIFIYGCDSSTSDSGDIEIVLFESDNSKLNKVKSEAFELIKEGRAQEAIVILENLLDENKSDRGINYYLGVAYGKIENNEQAIYYCSEAIKLDSNYFEAYQLRGVYKINSEDYEAAFYDFNKAVSIEPEDIKALKNRGVVYLKLSNKEMACEDFKKAIKLGAEIPQDLYQMACE
jgi:Flp pilus assembly protein TadD